MKKQIGIVSFLSLFTLIAVSPIFAQSPMTRSKVRENMMRVTTPIKKLRPKIAIGTGIVTAINGTQFAVEKEDKSATYTVLTGTFDKCETKYVRRFGGTSSFSEIKVGHVLHIIGRWQDDTKTTVEACTIRDKSIQKFRGTFLGTVESLTSDGFVLKTNRGTETVTLSTETKIVDRREKTLAQSDIVIGHRVRVKGVWDKSDNTLSEVTQVKDFNLPIIPTRTPKPSVTPKIEE